MPELLDVLLPDVLLPDVLLLDVLSPDVPLLPDVLLPGVPLPADRFRLAVTILTTSAQSSSRRSRESGVASS
ncbi:hypothetical protein BRD17_07740, partial [Halobacteriales archaeon SW_7_68_16]